jgi:hypothetical protein
MLPSVENGVIIVGNDPIGNGRVVILLDIVVAQLLELLV